VSDLANHLSTLSAIVGRVQTLLDRRDKNQALKVLTVVPSETEGVLAVIGLAGVSESCAGWLDNAEVAAVLVESDEALAAALAELDAEEEARRIKKAEDDAGSSPVGKSVNWDDHMAFVYKMTVNPTRGNCRWVVTPPVQGQTGQ